MNKISFFICGDIVNLTTGTGFISEELVSEIQSCDYSICNLEGPESQEAAVVKCPHQEPGTISYLNASGFNLFLLANNHITELGPEGLNYTIDCIKQEGVDYIGAGFSWDDVYRPIIREIKGTKFGFINICEAQIGQFLNHNQSYGYAWMGYSDLLSDVHHLSTIVDKVVVFVHCGLEHYNIPLPEVRSFYKRICDAGANVVVGGHPHTAQGFEYYNERLIIYSLGNFYFPYLDGKYLEEYQSYSVRLVFKEDGTIKLEPIHHMLSNNIVNLLHESDKQIDTSNLCSLLNDGYLERANEMCLDSYENLCAPLITVATCGQSDGMSFFQALKRSICFAFFRKRYVRGTKSYRESLLLRLFENESYRWTIIRALKNRK